MDASSHWLLLLMFLRYAVVFSRDCMKIIPDSADSIPVEVGQNFTATCHLLEGSRYTTDDIEWLLGNNNLSKHLYHRINDTAVSITLNIRRDMSAWLRCRAAKFFSYEPPCLYGISLNKGYPPSKPENLTCIAVQEQKDISSNLQCSWNPGTRDPLLPTTYTLYAEVAKETYSSICKERLARGCTVDLSTFPIHLDLRVWVNVSNALGSVSADEIRRDSVWFAKPDPPLDVQIENYNSQPENNVSMSLIVVWKHPIDPSAISLHYVIRYCQAGSSVWTEVPENLIQSKKMSFRLQSLQPNTDYVVQMRCIQDHHHGYWSDWSTNTTKRTPEAQPEGKPDLWRIIQSTAASRNVTLIWKAPVKANGKIQRYDLEISQDNSVFKSQVIPAVELGSYQMYWMELTPEETAHIKLTAANSAGVSHKATLFIPSSDEELPGVERVRWFLQDAHLGVEWSFLRDPRWRVSEYLLEWMKIPQEREFQTDRDWQRVSAQINKTTLTGDFKPLKRYSISVYPIYSCKLITQGCTASYSQAGRAVTIAAYTQQGPPLKGPTANVTKPKKNSAELTWDEVPLDSQQGFIISYTIFYKTRNIEQSVTVNGDTRSYVLTDLASESDYMLHVMASTIAGSRNGSDVGFKTMKYAEGEVEVIVVVVCLSFLFLTVFIIMFCLRKREAVKQLLWPQVPDPSVSSIAHWSPDFPIKANMPREDVSLVEVDVFDEEDKAILPLKKDKYLSEEHSSGIGSSSCMSSPRHSVSDSDEGDSCQNTGSTVQYSSVVASRYKGQTPSHQTPSHQTPSHQTPSHQPPTFARSKSTQPLLDCEEHPEHLHIDNSQSRNSYFRRGRGAELGAGLLQEGEEPNGSSHTFCLMEEMSPIVEDSPTSRYMPQQSGYRPQ